MPSSAWKKSSGFEYALFPAATGKPKYLVIYMHGVGGNASDLDDTAKAIQKRLPDADVISLQAPTELKGLEAMTGKKGYTWFPYGGALAPQVKTWLTHIFNRLTIADKVEAFAKAELDKRGLQEENLAYFGISMGAIVALQATLSGKSEVAAVVSAGGTVPPFTTIRKKPKIFLQMGEFDDLFHVPPRKSKGMLSKAFARVADKFGVQHEHAVKRLQKKGVSVTDKVYAGQGHVLSGTARSDAIEFIVKALKP